MFRRRREESEFNPGDHGALEVWFDAEDVNLSHNGSFDVWPDRAKGNDAVQTNSSNQPVIRYNQINGQKAVYFDGNNRFLNIQRTFDCRAIICVLNADSATFSTFRGMFGSQNQTGVNMYCVSEPAGTLKWALARNAFPNNGDVWVNNLFSSAFAAGKVEFAPLPTYKFFFSYFTNTTINLDSYLIGRDRDFTARGWLGGIAWLAAFSDVPQKAPIENYLKERFGLNY